jgi:hypothetical protein
MPKMKGTPNMSTYTELSEKIQGEFLKSLEQAQELNLKTLTAVSELLAQLPTPSFEASTLPTPAEAVEQGFGFASRVLEARKEFALKLAELATETQKNFAQTVAQAKEVSKN